jgi:tRNA (Thr-GGU) A37 N-methylase
VDYTVRPVAYIRNERSESLDDNWDEFTSTIELAQDVPSEALRGLAEFSHVEIVFFADWAEDVPPAPWHRRPRGERAVARYRRLRATQQGPSEPLVALDRRH